MFNTRRCSVPYTDIHHNIIDGTLCYFYDMITFRTQLLSSLPVLGLTPERYKDYELEDIQRKGEECRGEGYHYSLMVYTHEEIHSLIVRISIWQNVTFSKKTMLISYWNINDIFYRSD